MTAAPITGTPNEYTRLIDRETDTSEYTSLTSLTDNTLRRSKKRTVCLIIALVMAVSLIACIIYISTSNNTPRPDPTPPSNNCTPCNVEDDFEFLNYTNPDNVTSYNKVMVIKNSRNSMDMYKLLEACVLMDSKLWGMKDSDAEWEAVYDYLNVDKEYLSIWILGDLVEKCLTEDPCKKNANKGEGLRIKYWDSPSNYSRLDRNPSPWIKRPCIMTFFNGKWSYEECGNTNLSALCIKRNCCV